MQDPRGVAPAMYAPLLGFAVPGGQSAGASELIYPKSGQLCCSRRGCCTRSGRIRGERERISVAFNFGL